MGTRNLTAVRMGNAIKVAQYGQWDGYPSGQGETISVFLRCSNLDEFKRQLQLVTWATDKEIENYWNECGADDSSFVPMPVSDKFRDKYPELSRDTGAEVLRLILEGKVKKLKNSMDFLEDGVFCEYAYILDMDKQRVEIYTGGMSPTKVMSFTEFSKEGAMEKLENALDREGARADI